MKKSFILIIQIGSLIYAEAPREFIKETFMKNAEARIIDKLLKSYNADVRPSINGSGDPITVELDVSLMMVLEVDEKEEQMVTTGMVIILMTHKL
jgi:hypothetical protein